jgi:hypothetical protein
MAFLIAEIAGLLALAYTLGWAIGFAARRAATPAERPAFIPPARLAAVTGVPPVKAPIVAPLVNPSTAFPATRPGLAWAGALAGRRATPFFRPDEDAAMRAVEGEWSPPRPPASRVTRGARSR